MKKWILVFTALLLTGCGLREPVGKLAGDKLYRKGEWLELTRLYEKQGESWEGEHLLYAARAYEESGKTKEALATYGKLYDSMKTEELKDAVLRDGFQRYVNLGLLRGDEGTREKILAMALPKGVVFPKEGEDFPLEEEVPKDPPSQGGEEEEEGEEEEPIRIVVNGREVRKLKTPQIRGDSLLIPVDPILREAGGSVFTKEEPGFLDSTEKIYGVTPVPLGTDYILFWFVPEREEVWAHSYDDESPYEPVTMRVTPEIIDGELYMDYEDFTEKVVEDIFEGTGEQVENTLIFRLNPMTF